MAFALSICCVALVGRWHCTQKALHLRPVEQTFSATMHGMSHVEEEGYTRLLAEAMTTVYSYFQMSQQFTSISPGVFITGPSARMTTVWLCDLAMRVHEVVARQAAGKTCDFERDIPEPADRAVCRRRVMHVRASGA